MKAYQCDHCGKTFNETMPVEEYTGVKIDGYCEMLNYEACPYCGSDGFTDVYECPLCGEWETDKVTGEDYCLECYEEMKGLLAIAFSNFAKNRKGIKDGEIWKLIELILEREA